MLRTMLLTGVLMLAVAPAFAFQCPVDMKAVDAALAGNSSLSAAQKAEVAKLRAQGEAQHKSGKHKGSVDSLAKAKKILGLM